jgi:DNA-binding NarL/FixJ family response regulator
MLRVMIVARHVEVRDGLCTLLALAGNIEVTAVVSCLPNAKQQAAADCPDAALVDLEMPEDEGYATIRQLKLLYPKTKVIALTAHDYPTARARAIQAGARMVMVKGLDLSAMITAVQVVMDE